MSFTGHYTDTDGQTWHGSFFGTKAPGLRYKLHL